MLVDEPSRGITIMNIVSLTKEFQNDLIERANRRYLDVMTGAKEDSEGFVLSKNF